MFCEVDHEGSGFIREDGVSELMSKMVRSGAAAYESQVDQLVRMVTTLTEQVRVLNFKMDQMAPPAWPTLAEA